MGFTRRRRNQDIQNEANGIQAFDIEEPQDPNSKQRRKYDRGNQAVLGPFTSLQLVMLVFTFVLVGVGMTVVFGSSALANMPEDIAIAM
eukprot:gene1220-740_t